MESLRKLLHLRSDKADTHIDVNELIEAEIEDPKTISLHIRNEKGGARRENLSVFTAGMKKIAQMLLEDPRLSQVEEIIGYSWIVTEHPRAVERFGFTKDDGTHPLIGKLVKDEAWGEILGEVRRGEPTLAKIRKEDFLRRFAGDSPSGTL